MRSMRSKRSAGRALLHILWCPGTNGGDDDIRLSWLRPVRCWQWTVLSLVSTPSPGRGWPCGEGQPRQEIRGPGPRRHTLDRHFDRRIFNLVADRAEPRPDSGKAACRYLGRSRLLERGPAGWVLLLDTWLTRWTICGLSGTGILRLSTIRLLAPWWYAPR